MRAPSRLRLRSPWTAVPWALSISGVLHERSPKRARQIGRPVSMSRRTVSSAVPPMRIRPSTATGDAPAEAGSKTKPGCFQIREPSSTEKH